MARVEVQVDVGPGGNLERGVRYGNHGNAEKVADETMAEARADVAKGRTIVFHMLRAGDMKGLRVTPVGVVEEKETRLIKHDMTFAGSKGGGEGSVNDMAGWGGVSLCELDGVLRGVFLRVLGLRAKFWTGRRI